MDDLKLQYRAKLLLMGHLDMTEDEAHRYIQKQAMNNRRTRRLPRDFRRLPHPGMDPDAELIAEHRRLSAVVDVASLLGRETAAVRWTVYELRDLETELDARGVRVPRRWFTPNT